MDYYYLFVAPPETGEIDQKYMDEYPPVRTQRKKRTEGISYEQEDAENDTL